MSDRYFAAHASLSEWATRAGLAGRDSLIREDATKRKRLAFLADVMGLPIVRSHSFSWEQLRDRDPDFEKFVEHAGDRMYALRASPLKAGLPVLRNRRLTVPSLLGWLEGIDSDKADYEYHFEPHIEPELAAIFVVSRDRVVGEAINGGILQLNKGVYRPEHCVAFGYVDDGLTVSRPDAHMEGFLLQVIAAIRVSDEGIRSRIEDELEAQFSGPLLMGYFEAIMSNEGDVTFIDYNRELIRTADRLPQVLTASKDASGGDEIRGRSGCAGIARGVARVVDESEVDTVALAEGEILICECTSPEFVPLMVKAAAVVTNIGGVLSHAAIVCRELNKPCVVGTGVATERIVSGTVVEVDGGQGLVRLL